MIRKRKQEEEFLEKSNRALKILSVITGLILTLFYCINGGFYSLLFDLKESKTVIVYAVVIILLLVLLILCNMTDEPENLTEKQKDKNSYITVGIIILILFFAILLIFTLIDFFLPLIVLSIILIVDYLLVNQIVSFNYSSSPCSSPNHLPRSPYKDWANHYLSGASPQPPDQNLPGVFRRRSSRTYSRQAHGRRQKRFARYKGFVPSHKQDRKSIPSDAPIPSRRHTRSARAYHQTTDWRQRQP